MLSKKSLKCFHEYMRFTRIVTGTLNIFIFTVANIPLGLESTQRGIPPVNPASCFAVPLTASRGLYTFSHLLNILGPSSARGLLDYFHGTYSFCKTKTLLGFSGFPSHTAAENAFDLYSAVSTKVVSSL